MPVGRPRHPVALDARDCTPRGLASLAEPTRHTDEVTSHYKAGHPPPTAAIARHAGGAPFLFDGTPWAMFSAAALRRTGVRRAQVAACTIALGSISPGARTKLHGTTRKAARAKRVRAPSYKLVPRLRPCGRTVDSHAAPCLANMVGRLTPILAGVDPSVRGGCPWKLLDGLNCPPPLRSPLMKGGAVWALGVWWRPQQPT